jgi:hypothetical protein
MPGPNIAVSVTGPGLPIQGRRWHAYKTAQRELGLNRSQRERHLDRSQLKAGDTLQIGPYQLKKCP